MRSSIIFLMLISISWLCGAKTPSSTILVIGDSLSTAYGIEHDEGWVSLLGQRLASQSPDFKVANESISGQTTAAGLAQLPALLAKHPAKLLILELGGNDGLQGLPITHIKQNLSQMIALAQQAKLQVLLLGMQLPPNYGAQYTQQFKDIYPMLAQQHTINLVPFLLEGVGGFSQYMQYDNIHPSRDAQQKMLNNVWPYLEPLLK